MKLIPLSSLHFKLTLLSLMHFATDGLCAYLIFAKLYDLNPEYAILIFLGYNILAFVTQSPVGLLIDRYNKPKLILGISVILMLLGYALSNFWIIAVLLIGISNSLFHVAGGKYVTDKSGNDISHLGIFVSTGALGLVLGQRYLDIVALPYIFFSILLLCVFFLLITEETLSVTYEEEYAERSGSTFALLAVIGVVAIRSFVGKVVSPDFEPTREIFLLISVATALGKAMGGLVSKRFGISHTTFISMAVAAICLTFGTWNPAIFIIGVFAFNFTMPITLYYANILLKGSEGFAFGTLAAALAPGFFIAMSFSYSTVMRFCTAVMCILSMLTIIFVSKRIKNAD